MAIEKTDTVIVGGGQAGIAMSEHLGKLGIPHIVFERDRIAERWRTSRWDSLVANGPAWHDRFPNMEFTGIDADAFVPKEQIADYFVAYAKMVDAPIRCGVEVKRVQRLDGRRGFRVETSEGVVEARNVVAATGPFQKPVIPPVIPADAGVTQIHSNDYRNPDQLPEGAVLVVGGGSSGTQIADELLGAGRRVYLSIGPHSRPPRAYRGLDFVWWLGVLCKWDMATPAPGTAHVTIAVSGAHGGETVDFRRLAERGLTLLGMTQSFKDGVLHFAPDLSKNIAEGDEDYLSLLDEADNYIECYGLDLPEEPEARQFIPDPDCMKEPILELDLAEAGISTIIWATGFAVDYSWLEIDAFDENGQPEQTRGISPEPGIYFLGLPWLSRRGSSFIWGVWHDARFLADHIAIQHSYRNYLAEAPIGKPASDPRQPARMDG